MPLRDPRLDPTHRSRSTGPLPLVVALLAAGCAKPDGVEAPMLHDPVEIPSPAAIGSAEPNLARTPDGRIFLSWIDREEGVATLRFARWGGEGWTAPRSIARGPDLFVNWADFPSVAALSDGTLAAHWLVRDGDSRGYGIRIAISTDSGATWQPSVTPHDDGTDTEHGFVSMFPVPGGGLGAIWLDGRGYAGVDAHAEDDPSEPGPAMSLRYGRLRDGAMTDGAALDPRACDCCQTDAALSAAGPLVVYRDRSEGEVRDIAITRLTGGSWTRPAIVHADDWVIAGCPVNGPAVAAVGRHVAVAWFTAARDTPRVNVAFSKDAGASFGEAFRVDAGDPVGRVDVLVMDDGAAVVTWLERADESADVRTRLIDADGTVRSSTRVASSRAERAAGFPRTVLAGQDGDLILYAWTDPGTPTMVRTASVALRPPDPDH
jgi:hypothetical protein